MNKYAFNCLILMGIFTFNLDLTSISQAQVNSSGSLSTNVTSQDSLNFVINGGKQFGGNLFHSFNEFSVPQGGSVFFNNTYDIQNIFSRVTGKSISDIQGLIKANFNANLFIINPNGIIFGPGAKLDIGGSFVASTADQLVFADGSSFSAVQHQTEPLLTVSIPVGLRFGRQPGSIQNQSQAIAFVPEYGIDLPVGLSVKPGKTIALLGSEVFLEGGSLFAPSGRIEVGSVGASSFVSLSPITEGWSFGYQNVKNYQDINLTGSIVSTDGEGGGVINLSGRQINIDYGSTIGSTNLGKEVGKDVTLNASESVNLLNGSNIGNSTLSDGNAGDIIITTPKLRILDGSLVATDSYGAGLGGSIRIIAPDSVELTGGFLKTSTHFGNAGRLMIDTSKLIVSEGGQISTTSFGDGDAGDLTIKASNLVEVSGQNINYDFPSGIFSRSEKLGNAGKLAIITNKLIVRNGATVQVSATGGGSAGTLDINVNDLLLDDSGSLKAETRGGGGNISIYATDIILRNNSSITTNATDSANGGNITINTGVLLALSPTGSDGSDIKAKADKGRGGNIVINAKGIFGIEKRIANPGDQTNDIDASSEFGRSGQVDINTANNPNNGLTELPETVVDPDYQVAQSPCNRGWGNELTVSGRGGLPPSPRQDLSSEATQIKLVEPVQASNGTQNNPATQEKTSSLNSVPEAIVAPAQGWVYNKKGQVVLVAYNPTITGPQRLKASSPGCPVP
jgi:filamentous hemagglutinin family protein